MRAIAQHVRLLLWVVIGVFCMPGYGVPVQPVIPEMPSATLEISWSDLRQVLQEIQPPPEIKERPPVDWTLASVVYDAVAANGPSVRITGRYQIMVWKPEGWVQIPIIGDNVAPISALLDGQPTSLFRTSEGNFALLLEGPGKHELKLDFYVSRISRDGDVSFSFSCVPTPMTHMRLEVPAADASVSSPMAANLTVEKSETSLTADLAFRSTDRIEVHWILPALVREEAATEISDQTRIACLTSILSSVTDRYLACEAHLRYDVLRGSTDSFRLRLPQGVNILDVRGQGAAWAQTVEENDQVIEVKVNHQVQDYYELTLRYEMPIEDEMATVNVPKLDIEGVVRETGYIGVTARGAMEVTPGPEIEGLTRVDPSELPVAIRKLSPSPILIAYRYTEDEYLLPLGIRKLEDVPIRVASIDFAKLTTVVTDNRMAVTKAEYLIRNNVKQFLRIDLAEGAEVWGAAVSGEPVKPAREPGSDTILIPLHKSVERNRGLGAFPVSLVYMEQLSESRPLAGRLDLTSPSTDILANEMEWIVFLPERVRLYRSSGDLKRTEPAGSRIFPFVREAARRRPETILPLQEGMERFMTTDINNPAATSGGPRLGREGAIPRADIAIAGVLPIQVSLPTEGVAHQFRRVLIPQGEPLTLTLHIFDARLQIPGQLVLLAAGLSVGLMLGHRFGPRFRKRSHLLLSAVSGMAIAVIVALITLTLVPILVSGCVGLAIGWILAIAPAWFSAGARIKLESDISPPTIHEDPQS